MFNRKPQIGVNFGRKADAHYPNMAAVKAQTFPEGTIALEGLSYAGVDIYLPKEPAVTDHGISTQAYICPVCHDDHSDNKPHTFWPAELAAHDAALRAEIAGAIREACCDSSTGVACAVCEDAATIAEGRTP